MTSRLTECVIDCADPFTLSRFWAEALGYQVLEESADLVEIGPGGGADEARLADLRSGPAVPTLSFVRVPEGKPGVPATDGPAPERRHNRVHLDIRIGDDDLDDVVAKLIGRGARKLWDGQQGPHVWVTMADPEGNEFCVA